MRQVAGKRPGNIFDALPGFDGGRTGNIRQQGTAVGSDAAQVPVAARQRLLLHAANYSRGWG